MTWNVNYVRAPGKTKAPWNRRADSGRGLTQVKPTVGRPSWAGRGTACSTPREAHRALETVMGVEPAGKPRTSVGGIGCRVRGRVHVQ